MGTNYYLKIDVQQIPGRVYSLHLGKSSFGWAFGLRVYPEHGINTWEDWQPWLVNRIEDEYGEPETLADFVRTVTVRPGATRRHFVDGDHCIGHGEGSWDYIVGEFS